MTEQEVDRILRSLRRYYPGAKIYGDEDRLAAFRSVLIDFDFDEVVASCKNYVRTGRYFPFVQEIVAGLTPTGQRLAAADPARNAWMDKAADAVDAHVEERGGVCQLLHKYGGTAGETLKAHYPDADLCGDNCRKVAVMGACPYMELQKGV